MAAPADPPYDRHAEALAALRDRVRALLPIVGTSFAIDDALNAITFEGDETTSTGERIRDQFSALLDAVYEIIEAEERVRLYEL